MSAGITANNDGSADITVGGVSAIEISASGGVTIPNLVSGGVPSGAVFYFAANTAPTGYLAANGAAVSRATYSALFAVVGTTYGAGDGSTTFNLPDLRGQFLRGVDNGRGVDPARAIGTSQGDAIRNLTGTLGGAPANVAATASGVFAATNGGLFYVNGGSYQTFVNTLDASRQVPTAAENRPVNVALLACIKT